MFLYMYIFKIQCFILKKADLSVSYIEQYNAVYFNFPPIIIF